MADLRQALTPLVGRMVREHQVLHVLGEFSTADDLANARGEILKWAQKRNGSPFPRDSHSGGEFEVLAAGRSCAVVNVDMPEIQAWSLRQEDPDKEVAGRIWTCEATLWSTPSGQSHFAARLTVGSREAELAISPAVPGFVRQIVGHAGLLCDGRRFMSSPEYIDDYLSGEALAELLVNESRILPAVAFSLDDTPDLAATSAARTLATQLCGVAHFFLLKPDASWALTHRLGKQLSVYGRAARVYMPGFGESANPYDHRLWLGTRLADATSLAATIEGIGSLVAASSTRAIRIGKDILPFAQLRSISRQAMQTRLAERGASTVDQLRAANEQIAALKNERDEAKAIQDMALEEEVAARQRAGDAESREQNALVQVQTLLARFQALGAPNDDAADLPSDWEGFAEWCDQNLVGRVVLTGSARQGCRKAQFKDVQLAARCLIWLGNTCRKLFLEGGESISEAIVESGIRNSHCGADSFGVDWRGAKLKVEWHVKSGGNTRIREYCLRIYYAWDPQTQQIVVADMPAHRSTNAS